MSPDRIRQELRFVIERGLRMAFQPETLHFRSDLERRSGNAMKPIRLWKFSLLNALGAEHL